VTGGKDNKLTKKKGAEGRATSSSIRKGGKRKSFQDAGEVSLGEECLDRKKLSRRGNAGQKERSGFFGVKRKKEVGQTLRPECL